MVSIPAEILGLRLIPDIPGFMYSTTFNLRQFSSLCFLSLRSQAKVTTLCSKSMHFWLNVNTFNPYSQLSAWLCYRESSFGHICVSEFFRKFEFALVRDLSEQQEKRDSKIDMIYCNCWHDCKKKNKFTSFKPTDLFPTTMALDAWHLSMRLTNRP